MRLEDKRTSPHPRPERPPGDRKKSTALIQRGETGFLRRASYDCADFPSRECWSATTISVSCARATLRHLLRGRGLMRKLYIRPDHFLTLRL